MYNFFHQEFLSYILITIGLCRSGLTTVVGKLRVCPSETACVVTEKSFASMVISITEVTSVSGFRSRFALQHSFLLTLLSAAASLKFLVTYFEVLVQGASPTCAVSCKSLPGLDVNVRYLCSAGGDDLLFFFELPVLHRREASVPLCLDL